MVERIDDMPAGTIGFRASGKLSRDDYREVMEPGLRAAAEFKFFAWMTPGEVEVFGLDRLEEARSWVAEGTAAP